METTSQARPVRAGVFKRITTADGAVESLARAGFSRDHITVVCPSCSTERYQDFERKEPAGSKVPAAAAGGGAIGAVLGGLVAVAGAGLLVAGPLLAGIGALAGGFVGAMMSRGIERETTNYFDQALRKGDILVAVEVDPGPDQAERLAKAESVLAAAGAEPIPLREG